MKKFIFLLLAVLLFFSMTLTALASDYDLRTVSTLDSNSLKKYMHPDSRHLAEDVIRICAEQHISAEFITAVMRWERRPDLHNWFGWMGYDGTLMQFPDDRTCLETIIPLIKKNYLTAGGKYFNGYTVNAVSIFYNNSDFWRTTIAGEVDRILKDSTDTLASPPSLKYSRRLPMFLSRSKMIQTI